MSRLLALLVGCLLVLGALPLTALASPPDGDGRPRGPADVDGLGVDRPGHPDDAFGEDYVGDDEDRRQDRADQDDDRDRDGLDGRAERRRGTDPLTEDSDGDGLADGEEAPDDAARPSEKRAGPIETRLG